MWLYVLVIYVSAAFVVEGVNLTATTCDGGPLLLECPMPMTVISANYGRLDKTTCPGGNAIGSTPLNTTTCSAATSLSFIKAQCDRQIYCSLSAATSVFGDPCNDTAKYLTVTYSCPDTTMIINTNVACEGSTLSLQCPTGYIDILSWNYGRLNNYTCPAGNVIGSSNLSNTNCITTANPYVVNPVCDRNKNCSISVNSSTFGGDPCVGIAKYLAVTFSCTSIGVEIACENTTLTLQCATGVIVILRGHYGRTDYTICGFQPNIYCPTANASIIVGNVCNGQQNCSIVASAAVFGDPCSPGTQTSKATETSVTSTTTTLTKSLTTTTPSSSTSSITTTPTTSSSTTTRLTTSTSTAAATTPTTSTSTVTITPTASSSTNSSTTFTSTSTTTTPTTSSLTTSRPSTTSTSTTTTPTTSSSTTFTSTSTTTTPTTSSSTTTRPSTTSTSTTTTPTTSSSTTFTSTSTTTTPTTSSSTTTRPSTTSTSTTTTPTTSSSTTFTSNSTTNIPTTSSTTSTSSTTKTSTSTVVSQSPSLTAATTDSAATMQSTTTSVPFESSQLETTTISSQHISSVLATIQPVGVVSKPSGWIMWTLATVVVTAGSIIIGCLCHTIITSCCKRKRTRRNQSSQT